MNRIDRMFKAKRERGEAAMIYYLTAGYPSLEATERVIDALAAEGADLIELGIPFSDPVADGPTIQAAGQCALDRGFKVQDLFDLMRRVRAKHPDLAVIFFTAYNLVFHRGDEAFVNDAADAGADGLLVPDLPHEEAGDLVRAARARDLSTIFLVAPTTTSQRAAAIAEASTGFIYYISLKGVTGARAELPAELGERVRAVKALTDKPVAVGFGVSQPEQARAIAAFADGVIIGSALIKLIGPDAADPSLDARVRAYARSMTEALASAAAPRA